MGSNISRRLRRSTPAPSGGARDVLDAIRRIVQALRESSRAAEKQVGLSAAQLFVLRTLSESPGLSLNDLAERTRTHQSSVSTVVARLARGRLIERRRAAGDARRAEIRLSAAGRRRLLRAPTTAQEHLVAAVDLMPSRDRARLTAMLDRLVQRMTRAKRRAPMFFEEPSASGAKDDADV